MTGPVARSGSRGRQALALSLVWLALAVAQMVEIPLVTGFSRSFGVFSTFIGGIGCAIVGISMARRERKTTGATGLTTAAEICGWAGIVLCTIAALAIVALMILWARSDWQF